MSDNLEPVRKLTATIFRLQRREGDLMRECADLHHQLAASEVRERELLEYATHKPECAVFWKSIKSPQPCDCGFFDARKATTHTALDAALAAAQAWERELRDAIQIWADTLPDTKEDFHAALYAVTVADRQPDHTALDAALAEAEGQLRAAAVVMWHPSHPCYGVDCCVVYSDEEQQAVERQGYVTIGKAMKTIRQAGYVQGWDAAEAIAHDQKQSELAEARRDEREIRATLAREWVNNNVLCPDGDAVYEYVLELPSHGSALAEARREMREKALAVCTDMAAIWGPSAELSLVKQAIRALPLER